MSGSPVTPSSSPLSAQSSFQVTKPVPTTEETAVQVNGPELPAVRPRASSWPQTAQIEKLQRKLSTLHRLQNMEKAIGKIPVVGALLGGLLRKQKASVQEKILQRFHEAYPQHKLTQKVQKVVSEEDVVSKAASKIDSPSQLIAQGEKLLDELDRDHDRLENELFDTLDYTEFDEIRQEVAEAEINKGVKNPKIVAVEARILAQKNRLNKVLHEVVRKPEDANQALLQQLKTAIHEANIEHQAVGRKIVEIRNEPNPVVTETVRLSNTLVTGQT